jgi:hypothetical protein
MEYLNTSPAGGILTAEKGRGKEEKEERENP